MGIDKRRTATLKDIAAATGYSINTVSRALRGKEDIAPATRERIKAVAADMGHVSNMQASSLRLGYTNTIAVILGDISNPHFAIMMKEVETRARENGYSSFLINTNEDEELEFQAIQSAIRKNVDGIILCPTQKSPRNLRYLQRSGIPFVLMGRHSREPGMNYVICNDELGGYQATKALLDCGHRRILILHGPSYISSAQERLAGYRRAYAEAGLTVDERLVREVPVMAEGCRTPLEELDREGIQYTAIFAFSDIVGWSCWTYLREKGVSVPGDCSIVGFDHIQSRLCLPFSLTSISSYKGRMSVAALDLLIDDIKTNTTGTSIIIDTDLALGDSVAPPPGSES